jgi:hypothetical protein
MRARIVTFGTIAAVTLAGALVAAPSASAVKARTIDRVLAEFDSPLTGHGTTFVEEGKKNGIHPLFLVSIAGFESTLAKAETCGRRNPFGWGPCNDFKTWKAAIRRVALGLRRGYVEKGFDGPWEIGERYCGCPSWKKGITRWWKEFADPPVRAKL